MILVTGGTGFLGRNLLPFLLESGYRVRLITRTPEKYPWLANLNVEIIQTDIADAEAVYRAATGVRYIIHAAGLFRFLGEPESFEHTNIIGTCNILEAARQEGVEKLVHVSTIAVAGFPRPGQVITEDTPPNPMDDYQRTKLAGEQLVQHYIQEYGVPAVIARGGAFYGPHGRYAFNKLFFEDPLIHHWPMGVDRGRHITFPVYIKDMARGILLCLEQGRAGEIYNICSQSVPQRDVEKLIAKISGTSAFRFPAPGKLMIPIAWLMTQLSRFTGRELLYVLNMKPYILGDWTVSIDKARRELGFEPTPLSEGIRETLSWYVESGLWKNAKNRYR